jgi:uncharacterized protein YbjQ (UPF0145 family)
MDFIIFIIILVVAYFTGSTIERNHYKRIIAREKILMERPYVSDTFLKPEDNVKSSKIVVGSCVIAADRFKVFLGGLRSIFGGNVAAFESLTDRARREAILRMREKANNADMVVKTRIQFSEVGKAQVEVIAYGTAIYLEK